MAISPDGRFLITGSYDKTAKLWNVETGLEILTFELGYEYVGSVAFSPDGRFFVTVGDTPQPYLHWLPWAYFEEIVRPEPYDLTQLKALGLQFEWEDVEEMDRAGRRWKGPEERK